MRSGAFRTFAGAPPGKSLATRGAAIRTFGSFAMFLSLTLLSLGTYIIADEFANPLAAQPMGLFMAAFVLALAVVLLYYLVQPRRNRWRRPACRAVTIRIDPIIWTAGAVPPGWCELRRNLPYQRWYVDPARIRPRR
jgi:hypothetical protein